MKAILTPEAPVFTLELNGRKIPGMREAGQLGPITLLRSDRGHEAYVFDGNSPFAKAFTFFNQDNSRDVSLILGNRMVMEFITPPEADAPSVKDTCAQEASKP